MLLRTTFPRMAFYSISAALGVVLCFAGPAFAQSGKTENNKPQGSVSQNQSEKAGAAGAVARGKYIVESVAMCGTCHTPTDGNGNPDRARWLQGASVPYMPARPS